jgi:predicted kinase
MDRATLILLVGPKGAGKTFVGSVLEADLGVGFLRVEPIFLAVQREHPEGVDGSSRGYAKVEVALRQLACHHTVMCIETTAASRVFTDFLAALRRQYRVIPVSITAPVQVCANRVRTRDQDAHIPVSDQRLDEINQRARNLRLAWDLELENDPPLPRHVITERFSQALQAATHA